jgi:hypothetical protein
VAALDLPDRAVDRAVAEQTPGPARRARPFARRVAIRNAQRPGGAEDCVELFVREPDRGHIPPKVVRRNAEGGPPCGAILIPRLLS